MSTVHKQTVQSQSKRLAEAYASIFRALHFRHEFARRNATVAAAAATLAEILGFNESRFETFIQSNRPLTDELIAAVSLPEHGERREALAAFLETHRVLPVTLNKKRPFLAKEFYEMSERNVHNWEVAFNSLMHFEAYAMSKLGLGHPVIFPLMPLAVSGTKLETLKLESYDAPAFLNRSVPQTVVDHYSDALGVEIEVFRHNQVKPDKDGRNPQGTFEEYLQILDSFATLGYLKKGNDKVAYYSTHENPDKIIFNEKDRNSAISSYDRKRLAACYYWDNYTEIV